MNAKKTKLGLIAGVLLLLAGASACKKNDLPADGGIRFNASLPTAVTRAAYSGAGQTDGDGHLTHERIDWTDGDLISVYSPQATRCDGTTHTTTFNTSDAGFEPTLSYVQMRKLCSGETDCIFLPCAGWFDNSNFAEGNTLGAYKYSDGQYNAFAPSLRITASAVNASNSLAMQYRGPVRLLRVQ